MAEAQRHQLPAVLDSQAAAVLLATMRALRGRDVQLDGSNVRRLGALCLQIILAANNAWAADGFRLTCDEISPDFIAGLKLFGLSDHIFMNHESAR